MFPRPLFLFGAIIWIIFVGAGFLGLARYDSAPGALGEQTPNQWPASSNLSRASGLPTLIVMLHPRCPCSRATLDNLARAMPQIIGKAQVHLIFVNPDAKRPLEDGALLHMAANIPGSDIFHDQSGHEAQLFGALTSGETLLYSSEGVLLFHGGITLGRSHEGDNPGLSRVVSLVEHGTGKRSRTPVFGCALSRMPTRGAAIAQVKAPVQ